MVFCRECKAEVEDRAHFVHPINARWIHAFDPKIETLAYDEKERILEIAFKTGQVWQLAGVPPNIYAELSDSTISSFLKFIARRYKASPVKQGMAGVMVSETETCPRCQTPMAVSNRAENRVAGFVRIFWKCPQCASTLPRRSRDRGRPGRVRLAGTCRFRDRRIRT